MMPVSTVIVLSCDVVALIVMLILLYGLLFENSERDRKTLYFIICSVFTILSLAADIPAWYFENKSGYDTLLFIVNILSLVFSLGAVASISFYEIEIIGKKQVSHIHAVIIASICAVGAVLQTIGAFTGKTFTVTDGYFTYGSWYSLAAIVSLITLLYMEVLAIVKAKYIGRHNTLAFLSYMVLPLISVVIELAHPEISLALAATALSSLLLYVMLQSGHVSALNMRGELLEELSNKDMLTGLQNRRAYNSTIDGIAESDTLNVIFCDVNGLKYTNDTQSHSAGDRLLIRFAELMKQHFRSESIFRVSGDEFVVVIPELPADQFEERFKSFREALAPPDDIAAVGAASGSGSDLRNILDSAESRMYEDKKLCHERHPEYTR